MVVIKRTAAFGVLWDMDGTLVDTARLHYLTFKKIFDPRGVSFSWECFSSKFGMTTLSILRQMLDPGVTEEEIARLADEKEADFRALLRGKIQPLPGVRAWLRHLHAQGIPMAVASSGSLVNISAIVDELRLRPYFTALVSAAEMPSKPDPAVFIRAAAEIGVDPGRCIVVEDSAAGVQAARRAGMRCVAVTHTPSRADLSAADRVVESLHGLPMDFFASLAGSR